MKKLNIIRTLVLVTLSLQVNWLSAQNFQGIATYQSASKLNVTFAGEDGRDQLTEDMKKQLNKQMQKEYILRFNLTESTYKEAESLDGGAATARSGGTVVSFSTGNNGILYKNSAEARMEREADVFGKPFLVKDALEPYEWQLTDETRKIGGYNCQKAVYQRITDRRTFSMSSGGGDDENNMKVIKDTVNVTAWYTPDIPVSHGPGNYWGLPGLILEVNNGRTTLVCSKIVLNPKEGVELEMPSKGKVVTQAEFEELQEQKVQEMMKKFNNGGGGNTIRFGTGG